MAIANADGSVIIDTSLNTDGIKEGFKEVNKFAQMSTNEQRRLAQSLSGIYRKQGLTQSEAQKKAWQELKNGTVAAEEYEEALKDVETQSKKTTVSTKKVGTEGKKSFDSLQASLKKIVSYFIGFQTVLQAIRFSGASAELATQTEASVQRLVDIYGSASDSVGDFIDANARALGMSKAAAASFSSVYGNLFSVWADQATNAELTNRYLRMTAVVASKTGRTVEDVQERVRSGLLGNTEAIEDLGIFVNVKTIEMTDAFQRMADGKSWEQLDAYTQQQIRSMAILEQATEKYGEEVAETSAIIRARYQAAYQDFQNSWGNVVNTILLPVLETLTQIFDILITGLNAISGISGNILGNQEDQNEETRKINKNIKKQTKNQKALNKEIKKTVASFDEINLLSSQSSSGTTSEFGKDELNLPNSSNKNDFEQQINSTLLAIMGVVSVALIALGCILLFTGNIAWGIGFIIAGAALFNITTATLKDDEIAQKTKDKLSNALIIVGIVAIVLGVLLCFAAQWGIGIGLIVAGAMSIYKPISLNWDSIKEKIEQSAGKYKKLFQIGSVLMMALGVALLFTGVGIPFGLAWILAGAQGLSLAETEDWDFLPRKIKEIWGKIKVFWKENIAPIFTLQWWKELAITCGNGLIWGFESAANAIITLFEKMINIIIKALNKIKIELPDWDLLGDLAGKKFGVNISKVALSRMSIPRLAQGTVVPPNKEFMAVLGDNTREHEIVSPVSTIKQAVAEVLAQVNVGGNGYNGRIEVPVIIDGREIARAVREAEGNMGSQTVFGGFANVY